MTPTKPENQLQMTKKYMLIIALDRLKYESISTDSRKYVTNKTTIRMQALAYSEVFDRSVNSYNFKPVKGRVHNFDFILVINPCLSYYEY